MTADLHSQARGDAVAFQPGGVSSTTIGRGTAAALALAVVVALSFGLGSWPLLDPDEGRNAEVAREMAATNDYVLPHLNGLPYLDKPVLYFAASAAAIEVLGVNETAARLPSLLFSLAVIALTAWFGRELFSPAAGALAALVFAASPLAIAFSRIVIFDTALTLFIVFSIVAFYLAVESAGRKWSVLSWVSMGLGILTKGPVALALPLLVMLPYAIWRKRGSRLFSVAGIALFIAIVAAWVAAVSQQIPDFLHYALVIETFKRLTSNELKRSGPIWYFVPYLILGAFPWSVVALAGLKRAGWRAAGRLDSRLVFLALWILIPFVFFSLSQSKRPQYILPAFPAVALLVGYIWSTRPSDLPGRRAAAASLAVLGVILCSAALTPALLRKVEPDLVAQAKLTALSLGAVLITGAVLALAARRSLWLCAAALSLPALALPTVSLPLLEEIAKDRSARALVQTSPEAWKRSRIVSIYSYYPSISFYTGKTVTLVTRDGSEFRSNYMRRYPDRFFRENPGEMRRASDFRLAAPPCSSPEIFVIKRQFSDAARELSSILPVVAGNDNATAYGPCAGGGSR